MIAILSDSAAQLKDPKHLPWHWLVWKFVCTRKIVQATTGKKHLLTTMQQSAYTLLTIK